MAGKRYHETDFCDTICHKRTENGFIMDAVKIVGKGGRQEQKGTYYLRPTNIFQKWRGSEALFEEYHGLCLSQSDK